MQVIPVIDIRHGAAVRAIAGSRADYRPLAGTSAPLDVARGLCARHPFRALYIADLDAIEGRPDNRENIAAIGEAFPQLSLWVDAGLRSGADLARWRALRNVVAVLGSESFEDADALAALRNDPAVALSLDFAQDGFLGAQQLLSHPELWPRQVIVMTLARVGVAQGPDLRRVAEIVAQSRGRRVYAAGGVRGIGDLERLREAGAAGALVATALHEGRLTSGDLARLGAK
jgi:phosphoribosylformimino-5-aminoimidazole carboxamide ribotide isomerase